MTGQQFKFATVDAKAPDHDILAQMRVSCMNGRQTVSAEMGAPFTRGEIGAVWRFDEGPQDMEMLKVYGDPSSIPMIGRVGLLEFLGKKRFRFQISSTGRQPLFWEFDISGLAKVLPMIKC